jgi:hypothetical protein
VLPNLETIVARLKLRHFRLLIAIDDHGTLLKAANAVGHQPDATKARRKSRRQSAARSTCGPIAAFAPTSLAID